MEFKAGHYYKDTIGCYLILCVFINTLNFKTILVLESFSFIPINQYDISMLQAKFITKEITKNDFKKAVKERQKSD